MITIKILLITYIIFKSEITLLTILFVDHVAGAEIEDAHVLDHVVDQEVVIEIVGVHIVAVVVARVLTVKVHVESLVLVASLQIDKKIVVPNQGKFYIYRLNF